jgi:hypothetical protein
VVAERHAVIARAKEEHPKMTLEPLERLCELMGVSRSWYYEKHSSSSVEKARGEEDVVLRDAIERIVLEFPGYGYRRVRRRFNGRGGRSTISGFCASCVEDRCCASCGAASRRPPTPSTP